MIELKNIRIHYGNFVAIPQLDLEIKKGEFFTFLGPSGCGKTTTLRTIVGFITPSRGTIEVNGKDITGVPVEKRKIGIVFQNYALFPSMTVFENIAFGMRVLKMDKDTVAERVRSVAQKIDLSENQLQRNIAELSGGQQQRVALGRAIVMEPEILCLDEPLSNLDAKLRVGLRGELKRLQRELGITTLYVTHDQEEALTLSDRIAIFNQGKIEQVGTPDEIYNHSATEFVCDFIGDINRLSPSLVASAAAQTKKTAAPGKKGFIRIERTLSRKKPYTDVVFAGKVVEREYYGIYSKYTFEVQGEYLKHIELNSDSTSFNVGEVHELYFSFDDVMLF